MAVKRSIELTEQAVQSSRWPENIEKALDLPSGAAYFRCALQVNPVNYLKANRKKDHGLSEQEYNTLLVNKCLESGIMAIAVTDHNDVGGISAIKAKAKSSGITVFPGFEVTSSEGVHVLCIFDPDTETNVLERYLGDLGIHTTGASTKNSSESCSEMLRKVQEEWGGHLYCSPYHH